MTLHLTTFEGEPRGINALSEFRARQLLPRLQAISDKISGVSARFVHLVATEAPPDDTLEAQLEALQLRLREQEERMLCVVCLERTRSHVLLPCGHKCLCSSCVDTVLGTGADAVCPLCRTPIQKAQRVFDT